MVSAHKSPTLPKVLRLFLSADIEGSTDYKNQPAQRDNPQSWLFVFNEFYETFTGLFHKQCEDNTSLYKSIKKQRKDIAHFDPKVWRTLGDELVYAFELAHEDLAFFYVIAFKKTVEQYNEEVFKGKGLNLRLKATAWLAGFPVINAKIETMDLEVADYIGPSIDIGFRLTKFSTKKKFIISADLAYLLLLHREHTKLEYYFDGLHLLKGLPYAEYPLISLKLDGVEDTAEEQLLEKRPCAAQKLKAYLVKFFKKNTSTIGTPLIKPFIEGGETDDEYPSWYEEMYDNVCKMQDSLNLSFTQGGQGTGRGKNKKPYSSLEQKAKRVLKKAKKRKRK